MPPTRIPSYSHAPTTSQQPDLSPITSSFLTTTSHHAPNDAVRRNLFTNHASRRQASTTQTTSHEHQQQQQAQVRAQARPNGQGQTNPYNDRGQTHNAPSRSYHHQRSVSTPSVSLSHSLSPSPPRLSPYPPPNANNPFTQQAVPTIPVLVPPTPSRHALNKLVSSTYDPTISPTRPLTPRSSAALFPNSSIIALNPATGRPVLPELPVLPKTLRLSDSDDEGQTEREHQQHEHDGEEGEEEDDHETHHHNLSYHDTQSHSYQSAQGAAASALLLAPSSPGSTMHGGEGGLGGLDRERIERFLQTMMARQRARAKMRSPASHSHFGSSSPASGHTGVRGQNRRPVPGSARQRNRKHHDDDDDPFAANNMRDPYGVGADSGDENDSEAEREEEEKQELMGAIMADLRRRVGQAEEEGWMFGESCLGDDVTGVYD